MGKFIRDLPDWAHWLLAIGLVLVLLIVVRVAGTAIWLFLRTRSLKKPPDHLQLIGLQIRNGRTGMKQVVEGLIEANRLGLDVSVIDVEVHQLCKGNVMDAVLATGEAAKAGLPLPWQEATALQLQGHDILKVVREAVLTKSDSELNELRSQLKQK